MGWNTSPYICLAAIFQAVVAVSRVSALAVPRTLDTGATV